MFRHLNQYPAIVVTGPHRSGTTICGECIAADTGYDAIREEAFSWSNEKSFRCHLGRDRVVIQAPFLSHLAHMIPKWRPDALVVFMLRDVDDIHGSQERMTNELGQVTGHGILTYRLRNLHTNRRDAGLIYENWADQKPLIPNHLEVRYDSLKAHPKWLNDRSHFHYRQTA